jgi:hypothetical protein
MAAAAAALVVLLDGGALGFAAPARAPDPEVRAQLSLVGFLQQDRGRRWIRRHPGGAQLFPRLYNPVTELLRNNTLVRCRRSQDLRRRGRFFCVIRPGVHRRYEGLHVRYVRYSAGYFRIKWLYYRRGS